MDNKQSRLPNEKDNRDTHNAINYDNKEEVDVVLKHYCQKVYSLQHIFIILNFLEQSKTLILKNSKFGKDQFFLFVTEKKKYAQKSVCECVV